MVGEYDFGVVKRRLIGYGDRWFGWIIGVECVVCVDDGV